MLCVALVGATLLGTGCSHVVQVGVENSAALTAPTAPSFAGDLVPKDGYLVYGGYDESFVSTRNSTARAERASGNLLMRRQVRGGFAVAASQSLELGFVGTWSHTGLSKNAPQASDIDESRLNGTALGFGMSIRGKLLEGHGARLVWTSEALAMRVPYARNYREQPGGDDRFSEDGDVLPPIHVRADGHGGALSLRTGLEVNAGRGPVQVILGASAVAHPSAPGSSSDSAICHLNEEAPSRCDFNGPRFFRVVPVGVGYLGAALDIGPVQVQVLGVGSLDLWSEGGFTAPGFSARVGYRL